MERTTFKRTVTIGEDTLVVYLITDYRSRRPEFDDNWGIEIIVNEADYYFAGSYGDSALALAALRGICAMLAILQSMNGLPQDIDLSYFVRTWITPHNEITGNWKVMVDED